jgi:1-acyl-sn-glycerol-3-phosphate acyltransferase
VLRALFALLLLRPFIRGIVGVTVEGALPPNDPFLLIANHNSHLDTPVLLSLFAPKRLAQVRPVAAADYWMTTGWKRALASGLFNVLPIERHGGEDPLAPLQDALARGETLLLFPEGTRGEPEVMGKFHSGAARLLAENPHIAAVPVFLKNSGRSLPRGTALFVPFIVEVRIGAPLRAEGSVGEIRAALERSVRQLADLA